jgi:hypothetical protein
MSHLADRQDLYLPYHPNINRSDESLQYHDITSHKQRSLRLIHVALRLPGNLPWIFAVGQYS